MRVAEGELDGLALHLGPVADADDLQLALEAVLHPVHHVGDQRAGQAVQRAHLALVAAALDHHGAVHHLGDEAGRNGLGQLALGALGAHGGALHLDLHALRDLDGLLADARHVALPYHT